ncbi:unnamed protein product [Arabidopsis halleri]
MWKPPLVIVAVVTVAMERRSVCVHRRSIQDRSSVGNETFFGVCGLAVASCLDMLSSKTLEVPLRDISVAYRSSTHTLVAEDIVANTALSLKNALLLAWNEDSLVLQFCLIE